MLATPSALARALAAARPVADHGNLTPDELQRLTLFKWRYTLETAGFRGPEVQALTFLGWLRARGQLAS